MEETIFTKIINGEIPSHKVYEDDRTYAFLDIHPLQPGHVLVVPKNPVAFIWDLPTDDYTALMQAVQKIGERLRTVMGSAYVGVKVVGVDVPHAHVHLIPFDNSDQYNAKQDTEAEPNHQALAEIAQKIAF